MDLLRSLASSLTGGWSSRARRGGSERGMFEFSSSTSSTSMATMAMPPLPALAPLSPARSNSSITNSSNSTGSYQHHHQSPHRAAAQRPTARSSLDGRTTTTPHPLRRRPSSASASTLGPLDAGLPPPPSAPLPPEQVERYWRLQRRLAATLLPEVVRLEALCAEIAAAAAAAAAADAGASASAGAGTGAGTSSPPSPSRFPGSSPSASPRAGQDPHAATRIAALRRRTLVPLLARLRALPVSEAADGGGGGEATTTSTTYASPSPSSSSSRPCPPSGSPPSASTTTIPTRADLAALRRAAAVLPRYLEQLRVATRGRPRAYDAEKFCAAAAA